MTEDELHKAWSEWPLLRNHPWEHFVTLTFPWKVGRERAEKSLRVFVSKLSRLSLPAREARKVGLPWVGVVEPHQDESFHIHLLISGVSKQEIIQVWADLVSPRAVSDVSVFDPSKNAISYLTKSDDLHISPWFSTGR